MLFNSIAFIFYFLPIVLLLFYGLGRLSPRLGLGWSLDYQLHLARSNLHSGDTALLALEWGYLNGYDPMTPVFMNFVIAAEPQYFHVMTLPEKFEFISSLSLARLINNIFAAKNKREILNLKPLRIVKPNSEILTSFEDIQSELQVSPHSQGLQTFQYSFRNLDHRGDMRNTLNATRNIASTTYGLAENIGDLSAPWPKIRAFKNECDAAGIRVIATWSPLMDSALLREKMASITRRIESFRSQFKALGISVLGDPLSDIYPAEQFYDTDYHLNETGRAIRTNRIIDGLKTALSSKS